MVLDPNYKPPAGEEKLYHQQLMYVYKVLLNTVLESSLRAILHHGDTDTVPKMWEEIVSKAEWSTEAKTTPSRSLTTSILLQLMMVCGGEPTRTLLPIGVSSSVSMRSTPISSH
jgi:hypothetical protein